MRREQVISKGKYSHEQPSGLVGVKQYLFIKDTDGKKRLLLRFCNYSNERCSKFAFILYRMDAKGRVIGQERYESAEREYCENEVFSFNRKIDVEDRCTDFKVQVIYAVYGNYTYRVEDGDVAVSYSDKVPVSVGTAEKAKPRKIFHRTFDIPWMFAILSAIILAVGFTVMSILLMDFKANEEEFTLSGVTYRFLDNETKEAVVITGCSSTYREIYIANEIEGYPVVGIEDGAFEDNNNIVSLIIDGINIPDGAFENCVKLEKVVITNVTSIGKEAFLDCDRLESVVITEGEENQILRIGSAAFGECGKLKSVEINQTVAYGASVDIFNGSYNIETLKLRNLAYTIKGVASTYVERLNQLFGIDEIDESDSKLKTLVIENIEKIPANFAYGYEKLESVTIVNSTIKNVGVNAFRGCSMLSEFSASGMLTTVGDYAFSETAITEIDLSNVTSLGKYAFLNASKLSSVVGYGNSGIDHVPQGAFSGCKSLTSFPLHANIKHIYSEAFNSAGLKKFTIPQGVSYQAAILRNCQSLTELELYELGTAGFVGQLFGAKLSSSTSQITECIPNSLKVITLMTGAKISANAFRGCASVVTINLPDNVTAIGDNAFENCKMLAEVDIPVDSRHLVSIGSFAFAGCESLKTVPLPEQVQQIGVGALYGCNGLTNITLRFLGSTPGDDGDEKVSHIFNGTLPTSLKSIALIDSSIVNLPASAFDGCENVLEITIPSSVKSIGASAFRNCKSLVALKYSDSSSSEYIDLERITSIGNRAFQGCASFSEVKLNPNIEYIGKYAFSESGLTQFCLPEDVGFIGEYLLQGCERLVSFVAYRMSDSNGEKTISYFFGSAPSSLKSVTVYEFKNNKITAYAFEGCAGVTEFNLPEGITAIGEGAFSGCTSLTSFNMNGIETIDGYAFHECTSLVDCDLSRVSTIGPRAFYGSGLKSVVLSITDIAYDTFFGCASLTSVVLPDGLKQIGASSFEGTGLESITIPDSVKQIGRRAFAKTPLTSLEIPASVVTLGSYILAGCDKIESITFPMKNVFYETDDYGSYSSVSEVLFNGEFPQSLKSVTVNGISNDYIYSNAFSFAAYLEEIVICEGICDIYSYAFAECSRLNYVSLPSTLYSIDSSAFNGCNRLYEVANSSGVRLDLDSVIYDSTYAGKAPVVCSNGFKYACYDGKWYLVAYPEGSEVRLEGGFTYNGETIFDYEIPDYLFYNDEAVKKIVIPSSVKGAGDYAFYSCDALESVEFSGNTVGTEYIGEYAFAGNYMLEAVKLASSIKYIKSYAFENCGNLTSVTFPSSLEEIGVGAFSGCYNLNGVKLYQNVRSIGADAFAGCDMLYDVYCTSNYISLKAGEFGYGNVARNAVKIHTVMTEAMSYSVDVPGIGTFRTTGDAWLLLEGCYEERIVLDKFAYGGTNVTSFRIAEGAFLRNRTVREILITDAVKQIQAWAFSECTELVSVDCTQNKSLKEIEANTFAECYFLRFVTLPSTVEKIGDDAFKGCEMLESVTMPDALETIGANAFSGCSRLISIVIGANVNSIGSYAFYGCDMLYEVYNFSSLNIRKTTDYESAMATGYVAYNAYAVFTSKTQALERRACDGIKMIKLNDKWYVYSFIDEGRDTVKMTGDGTGIVILGRSFINGTFKKLVLPTDVVSINYSPFYSCEGFDIYYEGTEYGWDTVMANSEYYRSGVYYYSACVHYDSPDNVWTYTASGVVSRERCKENVKHDVLATCYTWGVDSYSCACTGCTYVRTEAVAPIAHEFENGACKNCGGKETVLDATTSQTYVTNGVVSMSDFEYDAAKKMFVSKNISPNTSSTFTITAKTDMTVSFIVTASCREDSDNVYVTVGDETTVITGTETQTFYKVLQAGQTLVISYTRGTSSYTQNDNCGYVKEMKIVEKAVEQSK